jgi:SP family sugar:H+ symporter-like MFS transporter
MVFPVIVVLGIFCVPESPRWAYKAGSRYEAAVELKRLRNNENVRMELNTIGEALDEEASYGNASWQDLM